MRLAIAALLVFYVAATGMFVFLTPVVKAPPLPTLIAFLIVLVGFSALLGRVVPTRVGVAREGLQLVSPLRHLRLPWDDIEYGVFIVDEKVFSREWAQRYYNVHLIRRDGKKVILFGLDGPVAQRIMPFLPGPKGRLRVFSGARLLGERPLDAHP